ncbi:signal transduction protein [Citrobacter koseri]|uniref:Signal transduction protein n=1 Tax=Citrobacter koseri TaxID=545 RepID=A0A2X2WM53_CITKO|nr:signal transduction protein [Citrobacter koseri]
MDKDFFPTTRPTFKRTLRRINMISVLVTMLLIWLLLCVASVLTLKQYAQKNLDLTAATMTHSLEAALVFSDGRRRDRNAGRAGGARGSSRPQRFAIKTRR